MFLETIALFGADRCMFASNFPVDRFMGVTGATLLTKFGDWVAHLPPVDVDLLFSGTARRVYRV
jgi:predicted TIM-barrel fold metal-dependent hydrolase